MVPYHERLAAFSGSKASLISLSRRPSLTIGNLVQGCDTHTFHRHRRNYRSHLSERRRKFHGTRCGQGRLRAGTRRRLRRSLQTRCASWGTSSGAAVRNDNADQPTDTDAARGETPLFEAAHGDVHLIFRTDAARHLDLAIVPINPEPRDRINCRLRRKTETAPKGGLDPTAEANRGGDQTLTSGAPTVNTIHQVARPTANSPGGDQRARTPRRWRLRRSRRTR